MDYQPQHRLADSSHDPRMALCHLLGMWVRIMTDTPTREGSQMSDRCQTCGGYGKLARASNEDFEPVEYMPCPDCKPTCRIVGNGHTGGSDCPCLTQTPSDCCDICSTEMDGEHASTGDVCFDCRKNLERELAAMTAELSAMTAERDDTRYMEKQLRSWNTDATNRINELSSQKTCREDGVSRQLNRLDSFQDGAL